MSNDDDPVTAYIEAKLHTTNAELETRFTVEGERRIRYLKLWPGVGEMFEQLFKRQAECLKLLFLHPSYICLALDKDE